MPVRARIIDGPAIIVHHGWVHEPAEDPLALLLPVRRKGKIVVLDGYTLNPGDLDWNDLKKSGELAVYDRSAPDQVVGRCEGAEILNG